MHTNNSLNKKTDWNKYFLAAPQHHILLIWVKAPENPIYKKKQGETKQFLISNYFNILILPVSSGM